MVFSAVLALPLAGSPPADDPSQRYFGDTLLVDQDGREHRFYSDLVQGKVVVFHVGFTRCTSICPVATATLKKVQDHLGARMERQVRILSITIDPTHDTPALLKEYAGKVGARPGWSFLTGTPENVEAVLRKLGLTAAAPEKHPPVLIVGNLATGLWKKVFALADAEEVLPIVDSVVDDGEAAISVGGERLRRSHQEARNQ